MRAQQTLQNPQNENDIKIEGSHGIKTKETSMKSTTSNYTGTLWLALRETI